MAAPETWPVDRKRTKWIAKPMAGPHSLRYSMAQVIYLRDLLKLAEDSNSVKYILNQGLVLVNGKKRRELNFPVGLFDVIVIPKMGKFYRVVINKKCRLTLVEIPEEDANLIPLKVAKKTAVRGKKIQLNFSNGWCMFTDNSDIRPGDTVIFDYSKKKIISHVEMKPGNSVYVIGGNYAGNVAVLKGIRELGVLRRTKLATVEIGKETHETALKYLFATGETKPEIGIR